MPAFRLRAFVLGVSLLELAGPAVARGEVPSASADAGVETGGMQRAQRMLLERAKQRYEAGRSAGDGARPHLEGALDALHLAYQLNPSPWLLFNMAQVQSRLGACRDAAGLYQSFLASDPAPEARASAEAALGLLGSCESANEEPPGDDSLPPGLLLPSSGDSIFTARAGAVLGLAPTELPVEPVGGAGIARALPWAFGSLAVIAGAASVVSFGEAKAAERDLGRIRVGGPEVAETQHRGESAQDLSRVFGGFAVGFALAAGASYLWLRPAPGDTPLAAALLERVAWLPLDGGGGAVYQSDF